MAQRAPEIELTHYGGWMWLLVVGIGLAGPWLAYAQKPPRGATVPAKRDAAADRSQSYVDLGPLPRGIDPKAMLAIRLAQVRGLTETEKLARDILQNPEKYGLTEQTINKLKQASSTRDFADIRLDAPEIRNLVDQVVKKMPEKPQVGTNLDPESRKRIADTLKWLEDTYGKKPSTPFPGGGDNRPKTSNPVLPFPEQARVSPSQLVPTPSRSLPPPEAANPAPDADQRQANSEFAQWLLKQSKRLRQAGGPWRDSRALKNAIHNFTQCLQDPESLSSGWSGHRNLLRDAIARWFRSVREKGLLPNIARLHVPKLPMPSLPRPHLPRVRLPNLPLPSVSVPHVGRPAPPGAAGGIGVLWVFLAVLIGVLAWKLAGRAGARVAGPSRSGWRLGPWPIDPWAVATRQDVIRAFEYLSLLRLGPAARTWNHLAIAARLGGNDVGRRIAADHLAAVYEQARYAPGPQPLAPEAILAARRELSFLAGVAPA